MKAILAAGAALLVVGSGAQAATAVATFNVTMTIASQCQISNVVNMNFGVVGTLTSAINQTSSFDVVCTNTTPYTIGLDAGAHASGLQRRMLGGATNSEYINYNLYSDAARSVPWGNVSGSWVGATGNGAAQTYTVYGQTPTQISPSAGANYLDTVTVTVTY